MNTDIITKSWGYEVILHNGDYCSKLLVYTKPIASSLHYHPKKHETFYVSSGRFQYDQGSEVLMEMDAGCYLVLEPMTPHRIRCIEPGTIVESSTHDDPQDCVRLIPSES